MNFKKIIRFQLIAWLGTLVNLGSLWVLHGQLKIPVTVAGACAIELAILHNFTWYYFRTWSSRVARTPADFFKRLWKYNVITAGVDFVFNLGTLSVLTHFFHLHYILADIIGMSIGPFIKIFVNELVIFKKPKLDVKNN